MSDDKDDKCKAGTCDCSNKKSRLEEMGDEGMTRVLELVFNATKIIGEGLNLSMGDMTFVITVLAANMADADGRDRSQLAKLLFATPGEGQVHTEFHEVKIPMGGATGGMSN